MNQWLDRYFADREEVLASLDDQFRDCGAFRLGSFKDGSCEDFTDVEDMAAAARNARRNAVAFFSKIQTNDTFRIEGNHLLFQSAHSDGTASDVVDVQLLPSYKRRSRAVVITPHWNAEPGSYVSMARVLALLGSDIFILNLPHHGRRSMDTEWQRANGFLNANLGTAIRSVRQSVSDLRSLIHWLVGRGYEDVSLVGISLGSCVAALTAAFEPRITRCALLLSAGDFGETVWTGRATAHIREAVESHVTLDQLKEIWSVISPSAYVAQYARRRLELLIISGQRDRVVLPRLTRGFVEQLRSANVPVKWHPLPCGHYTIGKVPFSIAALALVARWHLSA